MNGSAQEEVLLPAVAAVSRALTESAAHSTVRGQFTNDVRAQRRSGGR